MALSGDLCSSRGMKAIFIHEYVDKLDDIVPSIVPFPDFEQAVLKYGSTSLVRVKVCYTSPTHVDTLYARGLHQNNHVRLVHPPFILGTEFSGYVDDLYVPDNCPSSKEGSDTSQSDENVMSKSVTGQAFKKGDRVWGTALGSFASFVICPATALRHVPHNLSLFEAAGLGASTAPVSYGALVRLGQLRKGETCLVHAAAGGLGVAAVMIAKAVGANVIGTVGSEAKQRVVQDLLADGQSNTVNSGNGVVRYDEEGWEKKVLEINEGKGVDVVFDTVGLVSKSIRCCRFGGRIVIVGFVGRGEGKNGVMEEVAMNRILLKGVKVLGYRYGESARRTPTEAVKLWGDFDELLNTTRMKPVVYRHYQGIYCIPRALKELASRKVYGKIIIETTEQDQNLTGDTIAPSHSNSHKL